MKAIVIESPGRISVIETPKLRVGPGDVLTRVAWSGICGTDLAILSGDMSLVREGLITYPVRNEQANSRRGSCFPRSGFGRCSDDELL